MFAGVVRGLARGGRAVIRGGSRLMKGAGKLGISKPKPIKPPPAPKLRPPVSVRARAAFLGPAKPAAPRVAKVAGEGIGAKLAQVGPGTAFVGGMTVAELVGAISGAKDALSGGGGMYSGPSPDTMAEYGSTALSSQRLADKTALNIARLEARTRLKLAKIQRSRDLAMAYLSNPVVGIGVAYATICGVRTALELGRQYGDYKQTATFSPASQIGSPVLTMAGLTGLAGAQIPAWSDAAGTLYRGAAEGGAFGLLPEMAQLAGLK